MSRTVEETLAWRETKLQARVAEWIHDQRGGRTTTAKLIRAFEGDCHLEELQDALDALVRDGVVQAAAHVLQITAEGVLFVEGE